ncbi:hypothetical protein [Deinococcus koreensis]|uniref:hypothetical protein n=1 Tax=Deinococcus koreensis TaxID=2054903 RepID=UPI0013FD3E4C|nr:hypothetical protein [Deinococcus koreensis]
MKKNKDEVAAPKSKSQPRPKTQERIAAALERIADALDSPASATTAPAPERVKAASSTP